MGRRLWRAVPGALLVVAAAALAAWALGLDGSIGLPLISDRTTVGAGWPAGALPDLRPDVIGALLVPAAAIVLLGTLELMVSVRADESRPVMRREIAAQGFANIAGAFASAFPASASLTRSALLRFAEPIRSGWQRLWPWVWWKPPLMCTGCAPRPKPLPPNLWCSPP